MVKLIAFHLPQYHVIPENEAWWGEQYTEWKLVQSAKPLFNGQYQPRVPYNKDYYNMCDKNTQIDQANLAKKYGIYGFCYYHYWFNGKLLLERPMEIILDNKEMDIPFCMCWANEPWIRDGKVLIDQKYGDTQDEQSHFEYLLKFFKDERYIKINNMPLLVIYRCNNINNCEQMIRHFNDMCKKNGFDGIYIIEELNSFQDKPATLSSQGILEFEPAYTLNQNLSIYTKVKNLINKTARKLLGKKGVNIPKLLLHTVSYDRIWYKILHRTKNYNHNKQLFLGAFTDWDNTARKGHEAVLMQGASPEKFGDYLKQQIARAESLGSEFLFINAWNEWSEGAYLEPDEKFGYRYIENVNQS